MNSRTISKHLTSPTTVPSKSQDYENISLLTLQAGYACHQQPRLEAQNPVNIPEFCQTPLAEKKKNNRKSHLFRYCLGKHIIADSTNFNPIRSAND